MRKKYYASGRGEYEASVGVGNRGAPSEVPLLTEEGTRALGGGGQEAPRDVQEERSV